ncbi:unnamed protein product [Callosobruchus maculatus]|uniref:Uncharacterized protein n=1 Tax=Callosobruchus maculatus TaxID=64391 RepID=A0A653C309_CALMS|nr:unnamed protein product [Callosobruchus maculatus]
MESHFKILRKKLNDLGYTQPLRIECVPLVNKLLSDLKTTTENLQKCMTISKNALDELSSIELCAEPHKCDNVKLIEECNDLHLAFVHFKEQHEKLQKDLRTQNTILDDRLAECEAEKETLRQKLNGLKAELRTNLNCSTRSSRPSLRQAIKELKKENMSSAEEKYSIIQNEIRKLKEDKLELLKNNEILKSQLENRNQEVQRLLDGGRPVNTQARGYDNIDKKIGALQDEICALKADRSILGAQLKGALAKQHEAMRRALHLAERNKQLEKEMKDIDQIALQVEAECNKTVKSNSEKMLR